MKKYICIHGHFYQPPRENPWLEEVESQDSAYPYHDWNARITAECYAPNSVSRILGPERRIIDLVNNYSKISFNFGPTLLSWLKRKEPLTYAAILEADKKSRFFYNGHGAAIAQNYSHMILPLANSRDKRTQILWGIRDFEYHFKRAPEGMWLAETAVDLETLDIMAQYGIRFTILAPRQASKMRKIGEEQWQDVSEARINPRFPYQCNLPSGRSIVLFFYDGVIAQDIAFGTVLNNGEYFAWRLNEGFDQEYPEAQLVHIATDGESYGHHHRYGDMALAYCLHKLQTGNVAKITLYGEFLDHHPPAHEVEIFENSSWSCIHGIERWRSDCGCSSGGKPQWNQQWRAPLRGALDWLRDNLIHIYEEAVSEYVTDPWKVRDAYIDLILDRNKTIAQTEMGKYLRKELNKEDTQRLLKLLEMQRHALLMYTSCGWFFDEISGIETTQIIQYAARAIQLAQQISDISLTDTFRTLLQRAPSNIPELKNGAGVFDSYVAPSVLDLTRVGAHYAISLLYTHYGKKTTIYSYQAVNLGMERDDVGKYVLLLGKVLLRSHITKDEQVLCYATLHFGDYNITCGVTRFESDDAYAQMKQEISEPFNHSDITGTIQMIEKHFGTDIFSLWHLFRDEQRRILSQILSLELDDVAVSLRRLKEQHYPILDVMRQLHIPFPKILARVTETVYNSDLDTAIASQNLDIPQIQTIVEETGKWGVEVDKVTLSFTASKRINQLLEECQKNIDNIELLETIVNFCKSIQPLNLDLDIWKAQNLYFTMSKSVYATQLAQASSGYTLAQQWVDTFKKLGEFLGVRID